MGAKFIKQIVVASILATVYKIWEERNNSLRKYNIHTIEKVVKEIQYIVTSNICTRCVRRYISINSNIQKCKKKKLT